MDSSHLSASMCQTDMINVSDEPAEEPDMNINRVEIDLAKQPGRGRIAPPYRCSNRTGNLDIRNGLSAEML
jgi:hypothetical protein